MKVKLEDILDKVLELKGLLSNDDPEARNFLKAIGLVDGFEKEFAEIQSFVEEYDFKEALQILRQTNGSFWFWRTPLFQRQSFWMPRDEHR